MLLIALPDYGLILKEIRLGENMKDITAEQLRKWVQESVENGLSPDNLIIPRPKSKTINICGTEGHIGGNYVCSFEGIDIWVDERLPKDKAYLVDSKTMLRI